MKRIVVEMYVCQAVPTMTSGEFQAKVGDFKEHLKRWSESNEIYVIENEPAFRLGTGILDESWFDLENEAQRSILNKYEAITILYISSKKNY